MVRRFALLLRQSSNGQVPASGFQSSCILGVGPIMENSEQTSFMRSRLFWIVLVLGLAGIAYTLLKRHDLYNSAALYLGLPLLLALGLSLTPKTKSAMGATMKGMTIAMLLSALVLHEGTLCIIFASPLFYGVGALIAGLVDYSREKRDRNSKLNAFAAIAVIGLLAVEGTTATTTYPREDVVVVSRVVNASPAAIRKQLSEPSDLGKKRPGFLTLFPYPARVPALGLNVGDETRIEFVAYKHIWWTKVEGALVLKATKSEANQIEFVALSDDTYLSHYLTWQESIVELTPINTSQTRVTWTLSYQRKLDPAWYFGPLQHYAAWLAAGELIDHVATPRS
jgi:hypothetical protein